MKWIRSALASNEFEDVYFSEDWGKLSQTWLAQGGVWLIVNKYHYKIIDCNPEEHQIIAQYPRIKNGRFIYKKDVR